MIETFKLLRPGSQLANGATVLDSAEASGEWLVVLAQWHDGEFVTWKVDPDTLQAHWGDYFDNLEDATEDFKRRAGGGRAA